MINQGLQGSEVIATIVAEILAPLLVAQDVLATGGVRTDVS